MAFKAVVMARKQPAVDGPDGDRGPRKFDLKELGARVVSVFGAFNNRVLIEMDAERAMDLAPEGLGAYRPARVINAIETEIESWRRIAPKVADSTYAATAIALAYEVEDPYNSATSKAYCAKELRETMTLLRSILPAEQRKDGIDDLESRRADRLAKQRTAGSAETETL